MEKSDFQTEYARAKKGSLLERVRGESFPQLLERFRTDRGLTKADLAKRAGVDPSTITRFEQGTRLPERATVLQLADAMTLPIANRDQLLASAGFRSEYESQPWLVELSRIVSDPDLPIEAKHEIEMLITVAISHGKQALRISAQSDT